MSKLIRKTDGAEILDTDELELSKSMRLLGTDLGQQLMEQGIQADEADEAEEEPFKYERVERRTVTMGRGQRKEKT